MIRWTYLRTNEYLYISTCQFLDVLELLISKIEINDFRLLFWSFFGSYAVANEWYSEISSILPILKPSLELLMITGRPHPEVKWYLENKLIDETYQTRSSVVVNQLRDLKLSRDHLNAQLTCVANNTALANPISKLVLLNMNRKYRCTSTYTYFYCTFFHLHAIPKIKFYKAPWWKDSSY